MPDWRIEADGKQYEIPDKMTLGEQNILARDFGLTTMSDFELSNIRHVSGLLFVAMCRETPNVAKSNIRLALDAVTSIDFIDLDPDGEPEVPEGKTDPTQPAEPGGSPSATG